MNSFSTRAPITVGDRHYEIFRLAALEGADRLPYSLKILLENLLRSEDGVTVSTRSVAVVPSGRLP